MVSEREEMVDEMVDEDEEMIEFKLSISSSTISSSYQTNGKSWDVIDSKDVEMGDGRWDEMIH